jgi:hypothetical protein
VRLHRSVEDEPTKKMKAPSGLEPLYEALQASA